MMAAGSGSGRLRSVGVSSRCADAEAQPVRSDTFCVAVRGARGSVGGAVAEAERELRLRRGDWSGVEALLVLARGWAETALEVSVQVALVGEAGGGGGFSDRLASFEQAAGFADAVGDLEWRAVAARSGLERGG